jgi:hypothetical protein
MTQLYRYSINEARESKQLPLWRESHAENKRCRDFLDKLIKNNWDGMHLASDTAQKAVNDFGYDRTMWVLANHLQHNKGDEHFRPGNKEWAKTIYIPRPAKSQLRRDPNLNDHSSAYLLQSHPEKIDELTDQTRTLYEGLNLYGHQHCDIDDNGDYEGKIIVLRDTSLKEEHRIPENQLFLAQSGFGCDPSASGRAVFGKFLIDGEDTRFNCGDFIGVIDEQYLPEWAKEKLQQQEQTASDAPEEGSQPAMKGM